MTLLRPPASIEQALDRISGVLTWAGMGALVGRTERLVRAWGQPNRREYPTAPQMVKLDAAFRQAGGSGAPLAEAMAHMVEAACCTIFATADQLAAHAVACMREGSEANIALVNASRPGATDLDRRLAAREIEEAIVELTQTLPLLTNGAGPTGNSDEGPGGHP